MPKLTQHQIRQRAVQALYMLEVSRDIQSEAEKNQSALAEQARALQAKLEKKTHFAEDDDFTAQIELRDMTREVESLKVQAEEAKDFEMNTDLAKISAYVLNYDLDNEEVEERLAPEFFEGLTQGVETHQAELDAAIAEHLAKGWSLGRLTNIERAILRVGAFEILHSELPANIAINEAIELAKDFSDKTSSKFINGVLTNLIKK